MKEWKPEEWEPNVTSVKIDDAPPVDFDMLGIETTNAEALFALPAVPQAGDVVHDGPITFHFPDNSLFEIPAGRVTCTGARILWTWPRWLRLLEKLYRRWTGRWERVIEFSVKAEPPGEKSE